MSLLHATCVAIEGKGILLLGPSASGKSDLALRLLDSGAVLVSDDYVEISGDQGHAMASAPERIAGMIEARGIGILKCGHVDHCPLVLAVDLDPDRKRVRLPEIETFDVSGHAIPLIALCAFEASAVAKIHLMLENLNPEDLSHA